MYDRIAAAHRVENRLRLSRRTPLIDYLSASIDIVGPGTQQNDVRVSVEIRHLFQQALAVRHVVGVENSYVFALCLSEGMTQGRRSPDIRGEPDRMDTRIEEAAENRSRFVRRTVLDRNELTVAEALANQTCEAMAKNGR